MIAAGLIVSATLLLIFAPIVLAWIVGIGAALLIGAAILRFVGWMFVSVLGDIFSISDVAYRTATAGPRLPRGSAVKGLAIIFGPLVAAHLAAYVLSAETADDVWGVVLIAYIVGVPLWMFREYRKARAP